MNIGRSNIGVRPSSKERRVALKTISLQIKMTAGNWHQSISSVTSDALLKSC